MLCLTLNWSNGASCADHALMKFTRGQLEVLWNRTAGLRTPAATFLPLCLCVSLAVLAAP